MRKAIFGVLYSSEALRPIFKKIGAIDCQRHDPARIFRVQSVQRGRGCACVNLSPYSGIGDQASIFCIFNPHTHCCRSARWIDHRR